MNEAASLDGENVSRPLLRPAVIPLLAAAPATAFAIFAVSVEWGASPFWAWTDFVTQPVGLFFIVVGILVGVYHPDGRRMGLLLTAMGALCYMWDLQTSANPVLFRLGFALCYLNGVVLAHLLLAFPNGRLRSRSERVVIAALYVTTLGIQGMRMLQEHPLQPQLWGDPRARYSVWAPIGSIVEIVLTLVVLTMVVARWRSESPAARRARRLFWTAVAAIGVVAAGGGSASLVHAPVTAQGVFLAAYAIAIALLGAAALLGPVRTLLAHRQMSVVLAGIQPGADLGERLSEALGDPGLVLYYRRPDDGGYEGVHGGSVTLPAGTEGTVTFIGPAGEPVGAMVHDRFLTEYPQNERLHAAATVASLIIGLQAADRARLREVHQLHAEHLEGLERLELRTRHDIRADLHDGPQHLLSFIQALVGEARQESPDQATTERLADIGVQLQQTVLALREVVEGVFPSTLIARGLKPALEAFGQGAPIAPTLDIPEQRWPAPVEFALYNIISEAVGNTHKHANASRVDVRIRQRGSSLDLEISDDGIGGAAPTVEGNGIQNMRDRAAARGGAITIDSHSNGTTIKVVLPCD
ncbi:MULTISPECIES: sensor histidine kinase [unclassified Frankia]|uniref:sensor histidine kinase n=1 Tax=unclassified Frankia TaxID=2632575 RepID=UPI002AD50B4E|nr:MULTISPECIES: ATP-binding protein [unclassified Frankia]